MRLKHYLSFAKALMGVMHGRRAFGGPYQAYLALTNRCNITCIHCFFHSPHAEKPNLPSLRKAKLMGRELPSTEDLKQSLSLEADTGRTNAIIDRLVKMGTQSFLFTGYGEPFLHQDAVEFMKRIKKAGCIGIANTNGTLLTREIVDELIASKFNELKITLLAGTPEMYEKTHPGVSGETFNRLKHKLRYLAERKQSLGVSYPEVTLVCVVLATNCHGLSDFAEIACQMGADQVQYRPFDDVEDEGLSALVPTKQQAIYVRKQLIEVKAYLESKKVAHNVDYFLKVFIEQLDTKALYMTIPCYYGWMASRIDVNGAVYPCCRCYESLGNICEEDFLKIWHGNAYRQFRKDAFAINRKNAPVRGCDCFSCPHHTANLRVYQRLHPIKGRAHELNNLCPTSRCEDS